MAGLTVAGLTVAGLTVAGLADAGRVGQVAGSGRLRLAGDGKNAQQGTYDKADRWMLALTRVPAMTPM